MNLKGGVLFSHPWPTKFGIGMDIIWQRRNHFLNFFNGALWTDHEMMMEITKMEKELNHARNFQEKVKASNISYGLIRSSRWCPLIDNKICLNVDAARSTQTTVLHAEGFSDR